jgi:ElaB/YqjD/DUF883 family membrane-anchored ribosome-binding protein
MLYGTTPMSDAKDKPKEGLDDASVKAKQATERVVEKTKETVEEKKLEVADAAGRAKETINEGVDWAKKLADDAREKASDVTAGVLDYAETAVARIHKGSEQAAHLTRQGFRHADAVVRANPGSTLALVFGAGIGVGCLLGMALRPSRDNWSFRR